MSQTYQLLFQDDVYLNMAEDSYNATLWMGMDGVAARAVRLPRSRKKIEELLRKRAIMIGDELSISKTDDHGNIIVFGATVG